MVGISTPRRWTLEGFVTTTSCTPFALRVPLRSSPLRAAGPGSQPDLDFPRPVARPLRIRPDCVRTRTLCPSNPGASATPSPAICQPAPTATIRTDSPAANQVRAFRCTSRSAVPGGDVAGQGAADQPRHIGDRRATVGRQVDFGLGQVGGRQRRAHRKRRPGDQRATENLDGDRQEHVPSRRARPRNAARCGLRPTSVCRVANAVRFVRTGPVSAVDRGARPRLPREPLLRGRIHLAAPVRERLRRGWRRARARRLVHRRRAAAGTPSRRLCSCR